ncbi:Pentatricopeptide repeat [Dillenia turbinata]|uniref:Pentatricopeptide repeat n=1 Tax=Dillenia turbinata TaxID=194707 RepID=A0AAN8ZR92_9MAGN
MRELVIISSSSSSSTFIPPPNPKPPHHHKPKPYHFKPPPPPPPLSSSATFSSSKSPPLHTNLARGNANQPNNFAVLASQLAQEGRFEDFLAIAETVVDSGVESDKFVNALDAKSVSVGIERELRERRIRRSVAFFTGVEKLGISALRLFSGSAMSVLAAECRRIAGGDDAEEVVWLMEILHGLQFPLRELVDPMDIIKICVEKREPEMAVRFACLLPQAEILFCAIICKFGKRNDLTSALVAFEESKKKLSGPNMFAYRSIIDACGLCGDCLKSRHIYEELLAEKITPNIYVFNSLMNVNSQDLSYTLDVYKHMQNVGVMADIASYNILLKACCLSGRVDLAQDVYREVKQLESTGALKLDVFTYSTVTKVFADAKLWKMALKIKEDMLSAGVVPNTVTWSSLISACANSGLVEQATKLFEEMVLAGCEPNSRCCNTLLHACVEACQYDRAFRLFQSWKGSGYQETYFGDLDGSRVSIMAAESTCLDSNSLVSSYASNLQFSKSPKRVNFMPTTTTYNILMKACGTNYNRAKALMEEMETAGLSPNHISWSILIDIYGASGNAEGAVQILRTMCEAGIQPDVVAYTTAIKVCVENKHPKMAFSLFAEMKGYQIKPNLVTYNTLLRARSKYGSVDEVLQCLGIYQDMRKAGYKSNDHYLKELIEEWCEGVIQDNNRRLGQFISRERSDLRRPQSLLLEKVATHLRKSTTESIVVDLQGLTKVEARIVVLAVLRMIKENYTSGLRIKDDMLIILGVERVGQDTIRHEVEVKDAIIKLLQNELGLEATLARPRAAHGNFTQLGTSLYPDASTEEILARKDIREEIEFSTRRPASVQRLKVTKKSLYEWLRRRVGTTKR